MAETRLEAYQNAAGLLRNMGHCARVEAAWTPPGHIASGPVVALVTDAPPVLVGFAIGQVAEEPEAHLPEVCARAGRVPHGEAGGTPWAWFTTP